MPSTNVTQDNVIALVKAEVEKIEKIVGRKVTIAAEVRDKPSSNEFRVSFRLTSENCAIYAKFSLDQLAGNCGVIVANATQVAGSCQRKGIGTILQSIKELIAKDAGYSQMMATTNHSNAYQERILRKYGWQDVPSMAFTNRRTGNTITVWTKRIA